MGDLSESLLEEQKMVVADARNGLSLQILNLVSSYGAFYPRHWQR